MSLEHVSVEDSKCRRHYDPPELNKSTTFLQRNTSPGSQHKVSSPEVAHILRQLSDQGLFGLRHVEEYLHELYCRNCRPNTIRVNGTAIVLFCPNRQFMTLLNREKWVTLPSVKTNYTERSGAYEEEIKEARNWGKEGVQNLSLSGGVSVADGEAFPRGGIQRPAVARGVWSQLSFDPALG